MDFSLANLPYVLLLNFSVHILNKNFLKSKILQTGFIFLAACQFVAMIVKIMTTSDNQGALSVPPI